MTEVTLSLAELALIVAGAVALATTDAAAVSRLGVAYVAEKLGVSPAAITTYDAATDGKASVPGEQGAGRSVAANAPAHSVDPETEGDA